MSGGPPLDSSGKAPALGQRAQNLLQHPAARALSARLWGALPSALEVGLPRALSSATPLSQQLRADDIAVELVRVPHTGTGALVLLLPRSAVARVVDYLLGGDGQLAHASALRQGELGVLAYALARCCSELALGLELSDVGSAQPARLTQLLGAGVVWPFVLHTALGPVDLRFLASREAAAALEETCTLSALLEDDFADNPGELSAGDVLLSDAWPLTVTARGLEGPVQVRIAGCRQRLRARLGAGALEVLGATREAPRSAALSVVLGSAEVSLLELADFVSGRALAMPTLPADPVQLLVRQAPFAEGSLVVHRGELGVRVHSIR